eukprot:TRINITY_DN10286_c0_g1_i2.p1 TRINITY_DN10286_c0_g1~~TRINITY_DN10286_c0_g1_i2.p1  ORF type:complete len:718 (+),score=175.53 TRINITY_DN10286_c0_g1_i2:67-2220(+)
MSAQWRPPVGSLERSGLQENVEGPYGMVPWYAFNGTPSRGFFSSSSLRKCSGAAWRRRWFHLRNLARVGITMDSLLCLFLAELFCYFCIHTGAYARIHPNLFIACVVFPLAFAINAAYLRRERALDELGVLKSSALSFFHLHMDWHQHLKDPRAVELYKPSRLTGPDLALPEWHHQVWGRRHLLETYVSLAAFLHAVRVYLITDDLDFRDVNTTGPDAVPCRSERRRVRNECLREVYTRLQELSGANERLRLAAAGTCSLKLPFAVDGPIITRPIHWLYMITQSWEKVRNVRDHRTPASIRSYTKTLTWLVPILLTPYYAWLAHDYDDWAAYYTCFFVSLAFNCLRTVQDFQENPFTPIGDVGPPQQIRVRLVRDKVGGAGILVPSGTEGYAVAHSDVGSAAYTVATSQCVLRDVTHRDFVRCGTAVNAQEAEHSSIVENFSLAELDLCAELGHIWISDVPQVLFVTVNAPDAQCCSGAYYLETALHNHKPVWTKAGTTYSRGDDADMVPAGPRHICASVDQRAWWVCCRLDCGQTVLKRATAAGVGPQQAVWGAGVHVSDEPPAPRTGVVVPPVLARVTQTHWTDPMGPLDPLPALSGTVVEVTETSVVCDYGEPTGALHVPLSAFAAAESWGVLPVWPSAWPSMPDTLHSAAMVCMVAFAAGAWLCTGGRQEEASVELQFTEATPWRRQLSEEKVEPGAMSAALGSPSGAAASPK